MTRRSIVDVLTAKATWSARALDGVARALLLVAVGVLGVTTLAFAAAAGEFVLADFTMLVLCAAIAAFAWQPGAASLAVVAVCSFGVLYRSNAGDLLSLALLTGLVAATCRLWQFIGYVGATGALTVYAVLNDTTLADGGRYGVAGAALISLLVGLGARYAAARQRMIEVHSAESIEQLRQMAKAENEQIADALHDGIAHDITLVLFHARALPLAQDEASKQTSLDAIEESATHAMSGIRSMLTLERGRIEPRGSLVPARYGDDLDDVLASLIELLESMGIPAQLARTAGTTSMPAVIERELAHVAIEAVMNVIKHAPSSRSVTLALDVREVDGELSVANVVRDGRKDRSPGSTRRGLLRARERIEQLGGELAAGPTPTGWLVRATIPFEA